MGRLSIIADLLFIFLSGISHACETPVADLHFQGTIFEQSPFQVSGSNVDFFKNSRQRIVFTFDTTKAKWCYRAVTGTSAWPSRGCLSTVKVGPQRRLEIDQKSIARFVLREGQGLGMAEIRLKDQALSARFYDKNGKSTGKSVVFEPENSGLEISGWNCPNPNFLSCAGARIRSVNAASPREAVGEEVSRLQAAELSKSLSHYQLSCDGLREVSAKLPK